MKSQLLVVLLITGLCTQAQIGIGTTSPNSTLDVRGSFSSQLTTFSSATTASATDNTLVFTGTSAATLTLPDATACQGRNYWIKNTSSNASVLTIATTSSQTIDGLAFWTITQTNKTVRVVSNGTNWLVSSESMPGSSGTPWVLGGNSLASLQNFGTVSNHSLPFITNNTERMRLNNTGSLGIGSSTFNGSNPERLLVDAGTNGSSAFQNVIVGKGNTNSYAQLNIQNSNAGSNASSDVVATADNGNESTNFVDMGINSSVNSSGAMGGANDAYLYNMGQNLLIGTGTATKSLVFMTGGTTQSSNERMRINGSGNVGIGVTSPSYKLHIAGTNPLALNGVQTGANTDSVLTIINGVVRKLHSSALGASNNAWSILGNAGTTPTTNFIGTTDAQAFVVKENNTQVGRFDANSIALGNSATTNTATNSYAFGTSASIAFGKTGSTAIGHTAAVSGDNSLAIGNSASVTANGAYAFGNSAVTNSANAVAIGTSSSTGFSAASSVAIGNTALTNSPNAIAIGSSSTAGFSLTNPIAIGVSSSVNGNNAVALGNGATVGSVANSTAIGAATSVSGTNSTAIGYNTDVTQNNVLILGDMSNTSLSVGIGSETFSGTAREKLLVDAGASGGSSYQNVIVGKGNTNSYAQLNIQNNNNGTTASSDVVATSNNGNETINFIDMGINGGGNTSTGVLGGANTAYLYSTGNDFAIGNGSNNRNLNFFTTTGSAYTERMRITSAGNVGIGNSAPSERLDITGNLRFSGALMPNNLAGTAGNVLISSGAGAAPTWQDASGYVSNTAWVQGGNTLTGQEDFGTLSNHNIPFITNGTEKMRLTTGGFLGLGTNNPAGKFHSVTENSELGNDYIFDDYSSTTTQGVFLRRARGTVASPANAQNGDLISFLRFVPRYSGGLNFVDGSGIDAYYKGNGTTNLTDLRLFTSNTEVMRLAEDGSVGINTSTFNASNPEQLLVDAGSSVSSFQNVIVGKGNTNSYAQLNIQNTNTGTAASSDVVATSNNGNESVNFIDMGINGGSNTSSGVLGGANTAYLYSTGSNFVIGNSTNSRDLLFYTTSGGTSTEKVRILSGGNVGVNTSSPNSTLDANGSTGTAINLTTTNMTLDGSHSTVIINGSTPSITLPAAAAGNARRIYTIVNQTAGNRTISSYRDFSNTGVTTIPAQSSITIQSDGNNWYQIR